MAEMVSMRESLTRVELHGVPRNDSGLYANLHIAMDAAGFARIIAGNNNVFYDLPHATYSKVVSDNNISQIADEAYSVARSVWHDVGVISASMPMAFRGLKRT